MLSDYESPYLEADKWHDVRVDAVEETTSQTGTDGIQITVIETVTNRRGCHEIFWLTDAAMYRLAGFAKACGLTSEEMQQYDERSITSHRSLLNRCLQVFVEKVQSQTSDKMYNNITDWRKPDGTAPSMAIPTATPAPAEPPAESEHDGIPF